MIDQQDRDALVSAATKAVRALGAVPAFDIAVDGVEGPAARVKVSDKAGKLTPLYGFAIRKGTNWNVLDLGTFFEDDFYAENQIPESLQLK